MILKGAVMLLFLIGLVQIIFAIHDVYYMVGLLCSPMPKQPVAMWFTICLANVLGRSCLHSTNIFQLISLYSSFHCSVYLCPHDLHHLTKDVAVSVDCLRVWQTHFLHLSRPLLMVTQLSLGQLSIGITLTLSFTSIVQFPLSLSNLVIEACTSHSYQSIPLHVNHFSRDGD
jgi:hypothetical protein